MKKFWRFSEKEGIRTSRIHKLLTIGLPIMLILSGLYILLLTRSPDMYSAMPLAPKTAIDLDTSDDEMDMRDRMQIEKIGLEVPFYAGPNAATLEKGAWWRYPERGNPEIGGNFILSAHRFNLGLTPQGTRAKSPFYNLNKLTEGDTLRIFYNQKWYSYTVTRTYSVKPDAIEIEAPSDEAKLTIYSCSIKGSADGRIVVEAKLSST